MRRAASLLLPLLLGLSGVDAFLGSGLCSRVSAPARSPRGLGLRGGATTLSSCGAAAAQPLASKAPRPLPATFRQLYAAKPGSGVADVAAVRELPMLSPGPGQALIEVRYAGVNGGCETFRARANYWFERNKDAADGFALGAEGAGVVAAVGECDPTQRPSRLSSARPEILSPLTAGARGAGEFPVAFASNPTAQTDSDGPRSEAGPTRNHPDFRFRKLRRGNRGMPSPSSAAGRSPAGV